MQIRIILLILCIQQNYADVTFSTLNYPNPVVGAVATQHIDVPASGNQGVAVLFKEFLVGPSDCVILCETGTSMNCSSLCGDVMDHPKTKKIMRSVGPSRVTLVNEGTSDGLAHNGIAGKIVNIDLSNPTYFNCDSTYSLTEEDTFYFVSQNYPYTPTDFHSCQVKFTATNSIRFALYDFVSDQFIDSFAISGHDLNNVQQNITFSGRHVTDDEPFGIYFNKEATVSFQFVNTTSFYYQRGFYILVDAFTSSRESNNCGGGDLTTVDINKKYQIGAPLTWFSSVPYANNMNCPMNFTTPGGNTVIYLDLQYESEKCCDTMDLSGLTAGTFNTATYQGQQGRLIYLAASPTITMNFQSDGVQGGVGFRGTLTTLDCNCGGDYILSAATPLAKVMTPNFSNGAPTYCSNMNCHWTVTIPSEMDTQLIFKNVTLRRQFSAVYDTLFMTDNFGNLIKSFQSGSLTITPNMYPTSGKLSFTFYSCNSTSFLVNMMAAGFQIDVQARNRQLIRKNITFTDNYMFEDVSAFNFNVGKQKTLEFLVKSRPGKQVYLYFFTQIQHWAYVDIYDGPDTNSKLMDISNIIYNSVLGNTSHIEPPKIKSSNGVLLIRLKAYTESPTNQNMDFQGLVTDYENSGDCGSLVLSNSAAGTWYSTGSFTTNCRKVLRSTDLKYDPLLATYLTFNLDGISLYKGLIINDQHKLYSYDAPPDLFVADNYVIADISPYNELSYSWKVLGESTAMTLPSNQTGTIMTADFLPDHSTLQGGSYFQQQFTLELLATGSDITGIKLEMLAPLGSASQLTIEMEQYNQLLSSQTYSGGNAPSTIEKCGKKVVIAYQSTVGPNQGLYLRYVKEKMKNIILTTFSFIILSMSNVMTALLMGTVPQQLNLMFNSTLYNHYNLILDKAGLSTVWSVMNTASDFGVIVCVIFILPLLDSKGRKFVNVHLRCIMTISIGLLQCFSAYASSAEAFAIAQFLSGMGISLTQMTTVVFISECAPDKYRGLFSGASILGNAVGSVITFSLSRPSVFGNDKWPYIPAASAVLALSCYIILLRIHDSPKWLLGKGKQTEASKALMFYQEDGADNEYEMSKIQRELDSTCKDKMSWKECWKDDTVRSSLLIILSICMLIDFSSVNFELIFSVTIYGLVGIDTETALTINSIGSLVTIVLGIGGSYLLDKLGRRPMLYIMFVSLYMKDLVMTYALWASFISGPTGITQMIGILNRLLTILVGTGFVMPHLLIGELLPPSARVSIGQMALLVPILITTPLSAIMPITLIVFPPALYILFTLTHPLFIQHVYRYLPETSNKAVCDIVDEVAECVISRCAIFARLEIHEHLLWSPKKRLYSEEEEQALIDLYYKFTLGE